MPKTCSILGCRNHQYKWKGSHHFHQDPVVSSYWTQATGRQNWVPTKHSVVCSDHFHENDYFRKGKQGMKRHLKRGAIPNHTERLETLPKSAPKYKCIKCGITFGSIKEVESHKSTAHSNAPSSSSTTTLTTATAATTTTTTAATTTSAHYLAQEEADVKLAENIKHHLALTGDQPFDELGTERRAEVGHRLERILFHVANGSLDSLLGNIKDVTEGSKKTVDSVNDGDPLEGSRVGHELVDLFRGGHRQPGRDNQDVQGVMDGSPGRGIYDQDEKLVQKLPFHKIFV